MCENTDTQTETEREREMFHAVRDDVHDVHDDVRHKKGGVVLLIRIKSHRHQHFKEKEGAQKAPPSRSL